MGKHKKIVEEEPEDEGTKVIQPTSGRFGPMNLQRGKTKLDHPRNVLWKFLFSYMKDHRLKFVLFLILMLIGTAIMSVSPLLTATIIDDGIIAGDAQHVLNMTILYFTLMLFMALIYFIAQYGMGKTAQNVVFRIRNDLFEKLQEMSLTYFDQRPSGDIISIATNDIEQLNQLVGGQFVSIITSIISIILTVIFMFVLNPFLALISMVIFPIFLIMMIVFKRVIIGVFKESRKSISKVTSSIQENIEGAKVVQAYGQEKKASSEFDKANKANFEAMYKIRRIMSFFFPFVGLITAIITASIILIGGFAVLGTISVFGTPVTVGVLSAFIIILSQFFRPFMMLMQTQQIIEGSMAATDRIYSLLEERVEIPDDKNPADFKDKKGEIEFNNIFFGYIFKDKDGEHIESKKVSQSPESKMQEMMAKNPMMKRALEAIKSFPEPYSSFLLNNLRNMPPEVRRNLMMNLMGRSQAEIPEKIDSILAEYEYAVPNTEIARNHPEFKTSFEENSGKLSKGGDMMSGMLPKNPEFILNMVKRLEAMLHRQTSLKQSGGGDMGEGGGSMIGGGMGSPQGMVRILAMMPIPPEIYEKFPKIVKDAVEEHKKLIKHEESVGYVLENVNLKIPAGTTLAIVGETGAGKTTIIKLLSRFYDVNKGEILIDGSNIKNVLKKDLRALIGLVPQDSFIFTGTIKENLLYAFENPTPEIEKRMIEVSKFLGLHNFIDTLHKKYDTKLKENGSNISVGQRQLIAFARALITDPKILILDEATSSVDPYTETLIQDALDKAREGRTTIIIAHRLSTIKNADRIIVLSSEKHGIIEEGTHDSLMTLNGKYKRLLDMQYREVMSNE